MKRLRGMETAKIKELVLARYQRKEAKARSNYQFIKLVVLTCTPIVTRREDLKPYKVGEEKNTSQIRLSNGKKGRALMLRYVQYIDRPLLWLKRLRILAKPRILY